MRLFFAITDANMSRRQKLRVVIDERGQLAPDFAGTVRERQLRQKAPLPTHVAEVRSACLLSDQTAFDQDDGMPAATQKKRGGRAHDAAAHNHHIGFSALHS